MKTKLKCPSKIEIKKTFEIESARFLPFLPKSHPCSQTHGHSFKVTLTFQGSMDAKLGWLLDYNAIDKLTAPVLKKIDHRLLNKIPGLSNPTTENLTIWIYNSLKPKCAGLIQVTIKETSDTECSYPIRV